ncbi:MAG: AarF/ABC1/UbiB kinase family protein [Bauldia sp.]
MANSGEGDRLQPDRERDRLTGRVKRFASVGSTVGGVALRAAGRRLLGDKQRERNATQLASALGGLKGPLMKVAQFASTIPDLVPPEYVAELSKLQANAPPMGPAFVKRRMMAELGADWSHRFSSFDREPFAAASLGQVHRAVALDGTPLAVKLQYPDMQSAVEADLVNLQMLFAVYRRLDPVIDTREIFREISQRVREELDYRREARHMALYGAILAGDGLVRVPRPVPALSTGRLLAMDWLDGQPLLAFKGSPIDERNRIAEAMFQAWWYPFAHYAVIHGDPHLGNYTIFDDNGRALGINLLDYGCIRIFPARFVAGVVDLYVALRDGNPDAAVAAYETWGFRGLTRELVDALNIWARFIYGPLIDDRVRTVADGVSPAEYGRREAFQVHNALKQRGPVAVPREFVFMDRAAIGLGAALVHLGAELNFHELFERQIEAFNARAVTDRQAKALAEFGLDSPGP